MGAERRLIDAVHRGLPREIHKQSNTSGAATFNGIPDYYYDGPKSDLWVEYKALESMPRSGMVGGVDAKKRGCYSPLQNQWMERRWRNSQNLLPVPNVVGIVGLPNRTAVIQTSPTDWREGSSITQAIPIQEVIAWLRSFTGY
jgi:hypothetical protein